MGSLGAGAGELVVRRLMEFAISIGGLDWASQYTPGEGLIA